jgi:hypothetical protein
MTLQEKRTSMLALVESWKQSGMAQNEFAREQNITLTKFQYWVHKSKTLTDESSRSGFICLNEKGFSKKGSNDEIRLHYPNGTWLSLPSGIPVSVLKSLIDF